MRIFPYLSNIAPMIFSYHRTSTRNWTLHIKWKCEQCLDQRANMKNGDTVNEALPHIKCACLLTHKRLAYEEHQSGNARSGVPHIMGLHRRASSSAVVFHA